MKITLEEYTIGRETPEWIAKIGTGLSYAGNITVKRKNRYRPDNEYVITIHDRESNVVGSRTFVHDSHKNIKDEVRTALQEEIQRRQKFWNTLATSNIEVE